MKHLKILFFLFLLTVQVSVAQDFNGSFEIGQNDIPEGWNSLSGQMQRVNEYTITAKTGDSVIKASQGSYFLALRNQGTQAAVASSFFAFNKRSEALLFDVIYKYSDNRQRFKLVLTYTRWNSELSKRDTVAFGSKIFTTGGNRGELRSDWLTVRYNFDRSNFFLNGNPDSCFIELHSSDMELTGLNLLLVDNLRFSDDLVATIKETSSPTKIQLFPNPAKDWIQIYGAELGSKYEIYNLKGQKVKEGILPRNQALEISDLPSNSNFILRLKSGEKINHLKFFKN